MFQSRRRFILATGGSVASFAIVRAPARAAEFDFKLGDTEPLDHPINVRLIQFATAVRDESKGRMNISLFPYNTLGSATSMLAQLRSGAIQIFSNLSASFTGLVPVAAIDSVGFAFRNVQEAWSAMDGTLGAYVRREFAAKGLYAFQRPWDIGMREVTSSSHPIRNAADFASFKLRTPPAKIFVDMFATLGASPTPLDSAEMYSAMQTHLVDGIEAPLATILTEHVYEVQKYVSITNHAWAGHWMVANLDAWNALPADLREILERNASKYSQLQRADMLKLNAGAADALRAKGMTFNTADAASMRTKLGPYYAKWKSELGSTAWDLLEARVGKLA